MAAAVNLSAHRDICSALQLLLGAPAAPADGASTEGGVQVAALHELSDQQQVAVRQLAGALYLTDGSAYGLLWAGPAAIVNYKIQWQLSSSSHNAAAISQRQQVMHCSTSSGQELGCTWAFELTSTPHLELDDVGAEQAAQVGDLPQELHLRVLRLRHRAAHHLHRYRQHAAPHRLVHLPTERVAFINMTSSWCCLDVPERTV